MYEVLSKQKEKKWPIIWTISNNINIIHHTIQNVLNHQNDSKIINGYRIKKKVLKSCVPIPKNLKKKSFKEKWFYWKQASKSETQVPNETPPAAAPFLLHRQEFRGWNRCLPVWTLKIEKGFENITNTRESKLSVVGPQMMAPLNAIQTVDKPAKIIQNTQIHLSRLTTRHKWTTTNLHYELTVKYAPKMQSRKLNTGNLIQSFCSKLWNHHQRWNHISSWKIYRLPHLAGKKESSYLRKEILYKQVEQASMPF